jgi:hypothetical protein
MLGLQAGEGERLLGAVEKGLGLLRKGQEVFPVPITQRLGLPALQQAVPCVLPDGFRQTVAPAAGLVLLVNRQTLFHQAVQQVQDVALGEDAAHCHGRDAGALPSQAASEPPQFPGRTRSRRSGTCARRP